jgi:UDP-N-acetylglucosamine--N-acetylmuramyl-(pentapeptide) pyrophosphoryl-undecaprenol N-acetylglucosamine transferase
MKIVVACGGTGGHAFPGLAVAEELVKRGHDVTVWDSGRNIESSVMRRWKGPTFSTGAKPLSLRNIFSVFCSILRCRRQMRREKPDALIAMGSYSSLPPVVAAKSAGVKIFLHEANTVPGKAVEFLSRFADKVAISFPVTASYLPFVKTVVTGLPVRSDITEGKRFDFIPPDSFVVFVTGGSQGAHAVNMLLSKALVMMNAELVRNGEAGKLYVIHQTGVNDEELISKMYAEASIPARVHAFEDDMASAFASADLVVARAGASTCFELAACGKGAFLIPLPTALRNHQHHNAEAFAVALAASEGDQSRLAPRQVFRLLMNYRNNPERLAQMAANMKKMAIPDAAGRVADMLEGK